jgi:polyisoprenoid-binding protein YceI
VSYQVNGQVYKLVEGEIEFFSNAPVEDIKANTSEIQSLLDQKEGSIAFLIPIKSFQFRKSLMQRHFNENYMESDKFPNATFKGNIKGWEQTTTEKQTVTAVGEMTIHGVTNSIEVEGKVEKNGDEVYIDAVFPVRIADYDIKIPKVMFYNIAEVVEITVKLKYEPK